MVKEQATVLIHAVRGPVVLKYTGQLALLLALLTLFPLAISLLTGEVEMRWRLGLLCVALSLLGGLAARLPAPARIQDNEALTITVLAFLGTSLLMSWPFMGLGLPFMDALFEALSGVSTTGLSTLGGVDGRSDTFLFTRAWMQWYGGLGIVVLSVALLMGHQVAARRLFDPREGGETMMETTRTHARRMLLVYLFLTLAGLVLIWSISGDAFSALLQVLAAVSTGGFSDSPQSLAGLASRLHAVAVMVIALLGAVSLPLYWRTARAGWRRGPGVLLGDMELRSLLAAALVCGLLLGGLGWLQGAVSPWYHGLMTGLSAQTTTGFTTTAVADMDDASKLVMIISMLLGGSVGSSAGGIKILRLLILLRLLQLMIRRAGMPPHAVAEPHLSGRRLEADDLVRALQLMVLFGLLVVCSWLPFVVMGYDPLDALFEVVSASATVGLSSGITRPELEPLLKGVLCFDMLAGRLEILALLVVLYPRTWLGRREEMQ